MLRACKRDPTARWRQGAHAPLVHRDLTSSNILLGADGRACIAVRPLLMLMLILLDPSTGRPRNQHVL